MRLQEQPLGDALVAVEIRPDRAAVERLDLGAFDPALEFAFTLGLGREPVDIAAEPGFRPSDSRRRLCAPDIRQG